MRAPETGRWCVWPLFLALRAPMFGRRRQNRPEGAIHGSAAAELRQIRPVYFGIVVPYHQHRGFADMSLFVARRLGWSPRSSPSRSAPVLPNPPLPPPRRNPTAGARRRARAAPSSPQPVGTLNGRVLPDFATLVEQVGPAVVNVSVVEKAHRVAQPVIARRTMRKIRSRNSSAASAFRDQGRQGARLRNPAAPG